ncbi:MAG: TetR/AcrR family transcriptional regulator [Deltaproteobacteria bacterium]|nr:TetR/AcrR family transcriptional regulator [Deltaproteobacteria bacterium]
MKKAEERRTEILDAAQDLFLSRGYDATTVNDLLNAVGLSKGAFYHHFSAKEDVLQALVWRMAEQSLAVLSPIIEREDLGPLEKLKTFFTEGQQFKKEHATTLRPLIEVLFRDENLRLRLRATEQMIELVAPRLGRVLAEGAKTGVFDIDDPIETARLVLNLGTLVHEAFATALKLAASNMPEAVALLGKRVTSYERALERLLGIPKHSLAIVDPELLELFLEPVPKSGGSVSRSEPGAAKRCINSHFKQAIPDVAAHPSTPPLTRLRSRRTDDIKGGKTHHSC